MCEHPIIAYQLRAVPINAEVYYKNDYLTNRFSKLVFKKPTGKKAQMYYEIELPCGWCLECRLKKAKDWATRCYCENKLHKESCFVTLTYNEKNLPRTEHGVPTVCPEDIQLFFKKLLKKYPNNNIKRLWCVEYGEKKGRPHAHAIIFGYCPKDLEKLKNKSNRGNTIYKSKELAKIWGKGHVVIGTVTAESAGYVARYTLKKSGIEPQKVDRSKWKENPMYIDWVKRNGTENRKKCPFNVWIKPKEKGPRKECINASKRPAIGLMYWLQNKDKLIKQEGVYVYSNGKTQIRSLPKYFFTVWKRENWEEAYRFLYAQQKKYVEQHNQDLKKCHLEEEEWRKKHAEKLKMITSSLKRNYEQNYEDSYTQRPT